MELALLGAAAVVVRGDRELRDGLAARQGTELRVAGEATGEQDWSAWRR